MTNLNQKQIDQELITLRVPTHSDYLIHWTGKDIMEEHKLQRINEKNYQPNVVKDFLDRLLNILKYGLWLTKRDGDDYINLKSGKKKKPNVARLCFTELKLSDSYLHAKKFGPLGIGVKRYYLFNRLGAPMHYVHNTPNLFFPPHSNFYNEQSPDFELFSFFKNMSSGQNIQKYIDYDLYEESEWRIIYSENIKGKIEKRKQEYFIDPKDQSKGIYRDFYNSLPANGPKPEYLTPLDEWVALIIYPNLQIKNEAYENTEIRDLLKKLKNKSKIHDKTKVIAENCPQNEIINQIVEIDIGALKNF